MEVIVKIDNRVKFWSRAEKLSFVYSLLDADFYFSVSSQHVDRSHDDIFHTYKWYDMKFHMGRYLPKKGKACENNECRKARVIFSDLSLHGRNYLIFKILLIAIDWNF